MQHQSPRSLPFVGPQNYNSPDHGEAKEIAAEYQRLADTEAAAIPPDNFLSPALWKREFKWPNQFTTQQCLCLFRYYINILGPWFDVGDPSQYYTAVVPHRARLCPPLLNAIFTASARHIRCMHEISGKTGPIEYESFQLTELNEISTIKYYLATNAYLRVLAVDSRHVGDEDLLAATVITRFYEELDCLMKDTNEAELLARPFQLFVAGQARPAMEDAKLSEGLFFNQPGDFHSVRTRAETYLRSYQHASFRIALRQECQSALLAKREVQLPLEAWVVLNGFDEADDATWTDRQLYHHANVLQFCFRQQSPNGRSKVTRWNELRGWQKQWADHRPMSFTPYLVRKPEAGPSPVFPRTWYINDTIAFGEILYHFSRILLISHDPSASLIGPGHRAQRRSVENEIRENVLMICGIAMSANSAQPLLVQAFHAIAMFGEYFNDRTEQVELLKVLEVLRTNHGWPTQRTADNLKQEWEWLRV